jgi:hypothetical protein
MRAPCLGSTRELSLPERFSGPQAWRHDMVPWALQNAGNSAPWRSLRHIWRFENGATHKCLLPEQQRNTVMRWGGTARDVGMVLRLRRPSLDRQKNYTPASMT